MAKGMRTKKGTVTAKARKKTGSKGGKYPIFDPKSCVSAVKLRHHGKDISASAVLAKASRWAKANNCKACLAAIERAREADRKKQ